MIEMIRGVDENRIDYNVQQGIVRFLQGEGLQPFWNRFQQDITQRFHDWCQRTPAEGENHSDWMQIIADEEMTSFINSLCGPYLLKLVLISWRSSSSSIVGYRLTCKVRHLEILPHRSTNTHSGTPDICTKSLCSQGPGIGIHQRVAKVCERKMPRLSRSRRRRRTILGKQFL